MSARRSLVVGLGTLVAALVIAFGFYLLGLSLADPAAIAALGASPYLIGFAVWTLPLAALVGWIGGRWTTGGGRAFSGLLGAVVGATIGGVYAYAMLILTNSELMAYHFPVLWTWVFAAGLALLVAWTPARASARVLSALPIVAAIAWIISDYRVSSRPDSLMTIQFHPGTSAAARAEFESTVIGIPGRRGFDLLPGVSGSGSDSMGATLRFSPHASRHNRSDAERRALGSPLVASVHWFTPAQTESIDKAEAATFDAEMAKMRASPREAIILWYRPGASREQLAELERSLVDVPYAGEEVKAVARAHIHIERKRSDSDTTIAVVRFDPTIDDLWRGRIELLARQSPLVARTAWAAADEVGKR